MLLRHKRTRTLAIVFLTVLLTLALGRSLAAAEAKTWTQTSVDDFSRGTCEDVVVTNAAGGELLLRHPMVKVAEDHKDNTIPRFAWPDSLGRYVQTWVETTGVYAQRYDADRTAIGVEIADATERITIGMKLNLESEILTENVRPRYDWDSGRTRYGEAETDARFLYCKQRDGHLSYAFTEAARLSYRGQEVFAAKEASFPLQYVGESMRVGISKWRAWEGTAQMK